MMSKKYIIFDMSPFARNQEKAAILRSIRNVLIQENKKAKLFDSVAEVAKFINNLDIFLPFREIKLGRYKSRKKDYHIIGYGFLEYASCINYMSLEGSPVIDYIIRSSTRNGEIFELVDASVVESEKEKMFKAFNGTYRIGQLLMVIDGTFSNLYARVVGLVDGVPNTYKCVVVTKSNLWELELPASYLTVIRDDMVITDSEYVDDGATI